MKPKDYLKLGYQRVIYPDVTGGYNAYIVEFPGCYEYGDRKKQTLRRLEKVALSWIEATIKCGQEIPPPCDGAVHSLDGIEYLKKHSTWRAK